VANHSTGVTLAKRTGKLSTLIADRRFPP